VLNVRGWGGPTLVNVFAGDFWFVKNLVESKASVVCHHMLRLLQHFACCVIYLFIYFFFGGGRGRLYILSEVTMLLSCLLKRNFALSVSSASAVDVSGRIGCMV